MRNPYRFVGGRARFAALIMSLASALFLALFGAGLTSAKIQSLDDIKTGRATGVNLLQQEAESHLTQEEVLNSLSEQVNSYFLCKFIIKSLGEQIVSI